MKIRVIILGCLIVLLALFLYGTKYRFRNNSRVRYLGVYKRDDGAYASYDAFWKFKFLKHRLILCFAYPSLWSFIPIIEDRVTLADDMTMLARGNFKNKKVVARAKLPIKAVYKMNPKYHISVNQHFVIRETSRRILETVPFNGNEAELDYAANYLIILENETGYIMKIRK